MENKYIEFFNGIRIKSTEYRITVPIPLNRVEDLREYLKELISFETDIKNFSVEGYLGVEDLIFKGKVVLYEDTSD